MLRVLSVAFLFAPPLAAAPVPKAVKVKSSAPPVAGTSWHHSADPYGAVTYTFGEDGRVSYCCAGNTPYHDCGDWKADGDTITWHTHNHYADFEATFRDGKYVGTARNKDGKTWVVELVKQDK